MQTDSVCYAGGTDVDELIFATYNMSYILDEKAWSTENSIFQSTQPGWGLSSFSGLNNNSQQPNASTDFLLAKTYARLRQLT